MAAVIRRHQHLDAILVADAAHTQRFDL